jgi:hypothetical protein
MTGRESKMSLGGATLPSNSLVFAKYFYETHIAGALFYVRFAASLNKICNH